MLADVNTNVITGALFVLSLLIYFACKWGFEKLKDLAAARRAKAVRPVADRQAGRFERSESRALIEKSR